MSFVLDTPEQIDTYRLFTIYRGLKLEIETGIKMTRGSILKALNNTYGTNFKTKKQGLAWCEQAIEAIEQAQDKIPA